MTTNPRVFLWLGLLLLGWINYETWVRDYAPQPKSPNFGRRLDNSKSGDFGYPRQI